MAINIVELYIYTMILFIILFLLLICQNCTRNDLIALCGPDIMNGGVCKGIAPSDAANFIGTICSN